MKPRRRARRQMQIENFFIESHPADAGHYYTGILTKIFQSAVLL